MKSLSGYSNYLLETIDEALIIIINEKDELFNNRQENIKKINNIRKKLNKITDNQLLLIKPELRTILRNNKRLLISHIIEGEDINDYYYYYNLISNINYFLEELEELQEGRTIFLRKFNNFIVDLIDIFNNYHNNLEPYENIYYTEDDEDDYFIIKNNIKNQYKRHKEIIKELLKTKYNETFKNYIKLLKNFNVFKWKPEDENIFSKFENYYLLNNFIKSHFIKFDE